MTDRTDEKNEEIEVEIKQDSVEEPEQEVEQSTKPKSTPRHSEGVDDDDLSQYSEKVQKRINKLVYEKNQERRQREEALRLQQEAIRYAEAIARENAELKKRLAVGQHSALAEAKARIETEIEATKTKLKQAYEAGDSDGLTAAQVKLAELTSRKTQLEAIAAQNSARAAQKPADPLAPRYASPPPQLQPQPQPQPQPQSQSQPQVDPRALRWAAENPWFGKDFAMTGYAAGYAEHLVAMGIDPRSEEYYTRIDEELRRRFPEKFAPSGEEATTSSLRKPGNVVAPASRDAKAPRKVTLTPSAIRQAKRLGLTLEQYAAQLLREKEQENGWSNIT